MPISFSFILTVLLITQTTDVFAAAAVARRRQMEQQAQQQVQAAQEQAIAQQIQAMQQQAYMQQVQQYQEQVIAAQIRQQQEQAMAQQIVMQVQAQRQAYANAVNVRRRQIMDAQQQAVAVAKAQAYQKAAVEEAIKQKIVLDAAKMLQIQQIAQARAEQAAIEEALMAKRQVEAAQAAAVGQAVSRDRPFEKVNADDIKDVVDIADVWRKLDVDSRSWALMIDNQAKVATVSEYIDRFAKQGIRIQVAPIEYVHMIDDMAIQNPAMLNTPFKDVLQLVAIMNYDFDNGTDKDALAKRVLGEPLYLANKKRLGR